MTKGKLMAVFLLPMIIVGCQKHSGDVAPTSDQAKATTEISLQTQQPLASKIITKDPAYITVLNEPVGDDLLKAYSDNYNNKVQEIEAKVGSISNPDLRDKMRTAEWSKINKSDYENQAEVKFLQARQAVLEKHRKDWFEIGHVDYPGTDSLRVHSIDASPLVFVDATIPMEYGHYGSNLLKISRSSA